MAEYWKSAPKYWCKQCKIFIRDTAFEKTQHEATGKHQSNLKRFLRDIHRDNERQQRDSQRAKDEVERLRQTIAGSAGGKEEGQRPWKRASSAAVAAPTPQTKPVSAEERKRQMTQLAEMGVAIPEEFRGDMALAGEWQTVSERVIQSEDGSGSTGATPGVRKRKLDVDEEEEEAKREAERFVSKAWGSRTRRYPGAQEDVDLDALLDSTKDVKKKKISEVPQDIPVTNEEEDTTAKSGFAPVRAEADGPSQGSEEAAQVKTEAPAAPNTESTPEVKAGPEEAAGGVVFKKRKPKVMRR